MSKKVVYRMVKDATTWKRCTYDFQWSLSSSEDSLRFDLIRMIYLDLQAQGYEIRRDGERYEAWQDGELREYFGVIT